MVKYYNSAALKGGASYYNSAALRGGFNFMEFPSPETHHAEALRVSNLANYRDVGRTLLPAFLNAMTPQARNYYENRANQEELALALGIVYAIDSNLYVIRRTKVFLEEHRGQRGKPVTRARKTVRDERKYAKARLVMLRRLISGLSASTQRYIKRLFNLARNPRPNIPPDNPAAMQTMLDAVTPYRPDRSLRLLAKTSIPQYRRSNLADLRVPERPRRSRRSGAAAAAAAAADAALPSGTAPLTIPSDLLSEPMETTPLSHVDLLTMGRDPTYTKHLLDL